MQFFNKKYYCDICCFFLFSVIYYLPAYVNTQATAYSTCSLIGLESLIWYHNCGNSLAAVDAVKISVETDKEAAKKESPCSAHRRHRIENAQIQGRHPSCQVLVNIRHTCMRKSVLPSCSIKQFKKMAK